MVKQKNIQNSILRRSARAKQQAEFEKQQRILDEEELDRLFIEEGLETKKPIAKRSPTDTPLIRNFENVRKTIKRANIPPVQRFLIKKYALLITTDKGLTEMQRAKKLADFSKYITYANKGNRIQGKNFEGNLKPISRLAILEYNFEAFRRNKGGG